MPLSTEYLFNNEKDTSFLHKTPNTIVVLIKIQINTIKKDLRPCFDKNDFEDFLESSSEIGASNEDMKTKSKENNHQIYLFCI